MIVRPQWVSDVAVLIGGMVAVSAGWQSGWQRGLEIPEPCLPRRFDQIAGSGGNFVSEVEGKFDTVGLRSRRCEAAMEWRRR